MGLSGVSLWGSDIGGFFALSRTADHAGAARPLDRVRVRLGRDAHPGQRLRARRSRRGRRSPTPRCCRCGRATRGCARSCTRTSRRPSGSTTAPGADHAPAGAAYPDDPPRSSATTSSCSARTCWSRRSDPGATTRRVYLPRGRWIDWWRSVDPRAARRRGAAPAVLEGGREVEVAAPLDELPMFVRAGAVLPLLPPDVETLSAYGKGAAVRLADRRGRRTLLAWKPRVRAGSRAFGGRPPARDRRAPVCAAGRPAAGALPLHGRRAPRARPDAQRRGPRTALPVMASHL